MYVAFQTILNKNKQTLHVEQLVDFSRKVKISHLRKHKTLDKSK